MITSPRTSSFTASKPRTSLQSFGGFIGRRSNVSPLVLNRNVRPMRHPTSNVTPTIQAKQISSQQPKVIEAIRAANAGSKRSATLLGGLTPRLRKYGLSVNSGGRSGVIGSIKQSGRLATLYRGRQR
jgi:hypothetical protein